MQKQTKTCQNPGCEKELTGSQRIHCSNRCKQQIKYAIQKGKMCKHCKKPISKPQPILGGLNHYCRRSKECRRLHDEASS